MGDDEAPRALAGVTVLEVGARIGASVAGALPQPGPRLGRDTNAILKELK